MPHSLSPAIVLLVFLASCGAGERTQVSAEQPSAAGDTVQNLPPNAMVGYHDAQNRYWFVTYLNGGWKYDGARITHYPFAENGTKVSTYSIYKDRQGVLWVGTHEHGAWRFNGNAFERHFNK